MSWRLLDGVQQIGVGDAARSQPQAERCETFLSADRLDRKSVV
jgi:hypothetical protein